MTRHCNGNSGVHVQDGKQLDCAGCVPVVNSIQVWRPGTSTPTHYGFSLTWVALPTWPSLARALLTRVPASIWVAFSTLPNLALASNFNIFSHGSLL